MRLRISIVLVVVGLLFAALMLTVIVPTNLIRLLVLAGCGLVAVGAGLFLQHRRGRRFAVAIVAVAVVAVLLSPIRTDARTLDAAMVKELGHFMNTPYVWGGESVDGIDCSGLPRAARRRAAVSLALGNADPGLLRVAAASWLVDTSASAMLDGNGTVVLARAATIASLAPDARQPGTLIATADGTHLMVMGDHRHVVEADPALGRVVVLDIEDRASPWTSRAVVALRFKAP
jgi:hypothetical protein